MIKPGMLNVQRIQPTKDVCKCRVRRRKPGIGRTKCLLLMHPPIDLRTEECGNGRVYLRMREQFDDGYVGLR